MSAANPAGRFAYRHHEEPPRACRSSACLCPRLPLKAARASRRQPGRAIQEPATADRPRTPAPAPDSTRYWEGLQLLNADIQEHAEKRARLIPSAETCKSLAETVGLSAEELAEVESPTYRRADAEYIAECFLLRDAARALEVHGAAPAEVLRQAFQWVQRHVLLHEQGDDWLPPAQVLRRGYGSTRDRTRVFVALVRQLQLPDAVQRNETMECCLFFLADAPEEVVLIGVRPGKRRSSTCSIRAAPSRCRLPTASSPRCTTRKPIRRCCSPPASPRSSSRGPGSEWRVPCRRCRRGCSSWRRRWRGRSGSCFISIRPFSCASSARSPGCRSVSGTRRPPTTASTIRRLAPAALPAPGAGRHRQDRAAETLPDRTLAVDVDSPGAGSDQARQPTRGPPAQAADPRYRRPVRQVRRAAARNAGARQGRGSGAAR